MKILLSVAVLFLSVSSFAATSYIDCDANSDANLNIKLKVETIAIGQVDAPRVVGASIYDVGSGQTPDQTYQSVKDRGESRILNGVNIILQDGRSIDIEYTVMNPKHDGVLSFDGDHFQCFE